MVFSFTKTPFLNHKHLKKQYITVDSLDFHLLG